MVTVSVIIPTYNRAAYIVDSLNSVFTQTYTDYEVIVVDDGSTDDTADVLKSLIDQNKIIFEKQKNRGNPTARNTGIQLAKGRYVAFLDSDDLFLPTKLEKQVKFLDNNPNVALVHSWYSKFNDDGDHLGIRNTSVFNGWIYPKILLIWNVLMALPSVLVRKEILDEIGGFDEEQLRGPDLDLWRRISRAFPISVIPEVLSQIRVHPGNISSNRATSVKWFERYLQKAFDDDPDLGWLFRRRAWSKMYCNVGDNVLSSTNQSDMEISRRLYFRSICFFPFQLRAYLGLSGSFLPPSTREWMHKIWLRSRYRSGSNQAEYKG